uniref:TIL domain-containing protein n=1 Tax=Steinernema glaseri TaxID=37863 RepID=A0A1I8ATY2_9BILA
MIRPVLLLLLIALVSSDFQSSVTPPSFLCPLFEFYYPCMPCPLSCNFLQPKNCALICRPGCDCIPGFIRNETSSMCVPWLAYCLEKMALP